MIISAIRLSNYRSTPAFQHPSIPASQHLLIIVFLLVFVLFQPWPAVAFFPDFQDAVQKVDENLGDLRSLQLEVSFPEEPGLKLYLWLKGDTWRQEWVFSEDGRPGGVLAAAIGRGSRLQTTYRQRERFPLPVTFFWYRNGIRRLWAAQDIETAYAAYRFLDDIPCVVYGTKRGLTGLPQIWFHAEEYVPVRLKMKTGLTWTWTGYRNIGNFFIPHKARLDLGADRFVGMSLSWRGINQDIPDRLFDPAAFRDKFSKAPPPERDQGLMQVLFRQLPAGY